MSHWVSNSQETQSTDENNGISETFHWSVITLEPPLDELLFQHINLTQPMKHLLFHASNSMVWKVLVMKKHNVEVLG